MRWQSLALLLPLLGGCASIKLADVAHARHERVELVDVPFFAQRRDECGPASLATVLGASGVVTTPDALVPRVFTPVRHGTLQADLFGATRRAGRVPFPIEPSFDALVSELDEGRPVLVLQNYGARRWPYWHYAVVVGYDATREEFLLRSGTTRRKLVSARRFAGTWRRADRWAMVSLKPGEIPADATPGRYLQALGALSGAGRGDLAASGYEAAAARWPQEPAVLFALGNLRVTQRRPAEAESAFRAVLGQSPDDVPARNNLALLLVQRGCRAAALGQIGIAARAAATGPFAAEVADSTRTIANTPDAPPLAGSTPCPTGE